jgi:glycosyltransferase involved in cell wall biosynthesis
MRALARTLTRGMANGADAVVTPSGHMRDVLRSYGVKPPVHIVPTGVDDTRFAADGARRAECRQRVVAAHPGLAGKKLIFYAGRIGLEKNVGLLVESLRLLRERRGDVALVIAGDGPYRHHLEHLFKAHGLWDDVRMLGYVDRHELPCWYAAADAFAFPSRTETQGLVIIEAMLAGTPVVAVGEMGTLMTMGGDNGGFMTRNDHVEFAARLDELLADDGLWKRKSDDARRHGAEWTVERLTDRLVEVYRGLVEGGAR